MSTTIIDCFIFYNEIDLLTYRLNILNEYVDYFVIVESTHTFTGKNKNLFYNENKNLFEKFKEKIIHIIIDDFPYKYPNINFNKNEQWKNEEYQRNYISRGLDKIVLNENDIIIIADLDEIPDPNILCKIKQNEIKIDINILEMDFYYYNLNSKINDKWHLCKILSYKFYKQKNISCGEIRRFNAQIIKNGGWHLSYFGNSIFIKNKIESFSHQELNNYNFTDKDKIDYRIKNCIDLYDRQIPIQKIHIKDNNYLPPEYNEYLSKFIIEN
jgi:beta-1,4-mannosyl-glycoprotein beta-1,4-N-acetylglucosaminyltransferase